MQLPTPLLRKNPDAHKNTFGHALILAGSRRMLGAGALAGLSAMRAGAGLVTLGVPKTLNIALQKKISPVIMTWPLAQTPQQTFSPSAWRAVKKEIPKFQAAAIGPGLSLNAGTQKFIHAVIRNAPVPLVIDADALNALSGRPQLLLKTGTPKILTPHPGEFRRLTKIPNRKLKTLDQKTLAKTALDFAQKYQCILVLKGHRTIVASAGGNLYTNTTGNAGMATAGSGDVLTGMITAFLAQGIPPFDAAKAAVYTHGKAGDAAAKKTGKASLIATDIIDFIPKALKGLRIRRIKDQED